MTEMEVGDSLVARRSKRSTAGNRMQAALAEMSIDDLSHDAEEDVDFVVKVDEEDAFESDFASTEEEEGADEEAGERALEEEERMARRAARQQLWKTPKLPRRVAFESPAQGDKDVVTTSSVKPKLKPIRRVSLGQIIDAETGEVMETPLGKRKSTREATRINTQEVQSRIKDAESRRVSLTKRPKEVKRRKTQADLIAAALDLEEENIKSHREYLAVEEERRRKARVVKPVTAGPKVRWRSKIEEVTVTVYDPAPPPPPPPAYPPPWPSPYTSTAPYSPYIPPPFPGQPSPAPSPFPYASYNIPPPFSVPVSTATVPAVAPTSPAALSPTMPPSTPAPPSKTLASTTQDSTTATPAPPPAPAPTSVSAAVPLLPQPSTSTPPSDTTPATPPISSASVPPPSMPPRFPPPALPSARPKTPPNSSTAVVPATPIASTSTSSATPAIPAPVSTPAPAPGTSNGAPPFPPPPTTPGFPYPYPGYYPYSYYTPTPTNRPGQPQMPYPPYTPYYPYTPSPVGQYGAARPQQLQLQPPQQIPRKTTEKQTKNYVEVLLNEERPKEKPSWRETMDAMFGKHADWDNVRVYVGKNRPSSRQIQVCPITGLSARYRDPRSGVPYANLGAFRILSRLLAHEYVWSPTGAPGGVFVGHEKQRGAIGVPDSWADAMAGIPPKQPELPAPPPKHEEKAKKETKAKETQRPQKEVRVGERRSSRIAAEATGSSGIAPSAPSNDNTLRGTDKMNAG